MTRQASTRAQPCNDCRVDTSLATGNGHYYAVREDVWRRAVPKSGGRRPPRYLCLDCLEARLGAPLTQADFLATPPEILARFAGEAREPKPPSERQRELDEWRAFTAGKNEPAGQPRPG
jgi:hypothetical protein